MAGPNDLPPPPGDPATPSSGTANGESDMTTSAHPKKSGQKKQSQGATISTTRQVTTSTGRPLDRSPYDIRPTYRSRPLSSSSPATSLSSFHREENRGGMTSLVKEAQQATQELQRIVKETASVAAEFNTHFNNANKSTNVAATNVSAFSVPPVRNNCPTGHVAAAIAAVPGSTPNLSALLVLPTFAAFSASATQPSSSSQRNFPRHREAEAPRVSRSLLNLPNEIIIKTAECLFERDAYASVAALVGVCQHTRQLLRPVMKKIKKTVVLDLDDLPWSDKKAWKKIRIITCTRDRALPYSADDFSSKEGLRTIRQDLLYLQPWAIICKGMPAESVLKLQEYAFPSATVVRCNTNTALQEMPYIFEESASAKARAEWLIENTNSAIRALHKRSLTKRFGLPALRFRYHNNYVSDLRKDQPGQMFVRWTATEWNRYTVVEKESCALTQLETMQEDLRDWLWNCKEHSLPFDDTTGFETISLDLYFEPRPSSTGLFYSVDDQYPPAYDVLSDYARYAAEKWLQSTSLKPIAEFKLRFFVLHGGFLEREKMRPVYETHLGKKFDGVVAVRELHIDDNDFAKCVEKGGCSRCKPEEKR